MAGTQEPQRWLLVAVSTAGSSTLRVYAWRKLRSLGGLYLQNSVALLPERESTTRAVDRLVERLRREGGGGRVLPISIGDAAQERELVDRARAERAGEYREICSRAPALLEEIAMERERGRATYAEVEESEADLGRLQTWLGRVRSRDYFDAPGREQAEAAVERCADALAAFEAEALSAEIETDERSSAREQTRLRLADEV
jgi:hypothetical protein